MDFLTKFKEIVFKYNFCYITEWSLEIYFSIRLSNDFLGVDRPSPCEIFGYRPTTFTVHKIILSGNFGKERSLFKKSFVSLIYDLTACAKVCRWKSKIADIFSVKIKYYTVVYVF